MLTIMQKVAPRAFKTALYIGFGFVLGVAVGFYGVLAVIALAS